MAFFRVCLLICESPRPSVVFVLNPFVCLLFVCLLFRLSVRTWAVWFLCQCLFLLFVAVKQTYSAFGPVVRTVFLQEIVVSEVVSQVESAPPPMTQEAQDADHQDLLAFADKWAAETVQVESRKLVV